MNEITKLLFLHKDEEYKEFQSTLIPTVPYEKVIGVRMPMVRKIAKLYLGTKVAKDFMKALPHEYYDENNVHACLIEGIKNFEECIFALDEFLPFIDNWGTCDMMSPSVLKKNPEGLLPKIYEWLSSKHTYTVRYGIGALMKYFLDERFSAEHLKIVSEIKSDEYYIKMMVAWYFATALAKQYDSTIGYIEVKRLDEWTHRKAIQKAVESYRISPERKSYLRTLR